MNHPLHKTEISFLMSASCSQAFDEVDGTTPFQLVTSDDQLYRDSDYSWEAYIQA